MTVNEFKKSYRDFLINVTRHSYNSANKYISYINKACLLPGIKTKPNELFYKFK